MEAPAQAPPPSYDFTDSKHPIDTKHPIDSKQENPFDDADSYPEKRQLPPGGQYAPPAHPPYGQNAAAAPPPTQQQYASSHPLAGPLNNRTFDIWYDNLAWRKATVVDRLTKQDLFRLELHMRSPELIMYPMAEGPSSARRAHATLHCLSSRIDVLVNSRNIELLSRGMFKDGYSYRSPVRNGEKMTWRSKSALKHLSIVCEDESGTHVASFSMSCWNLKKTGTFELVGQQAVVEGMMMEELLMTGLAVMQQRYTTYNATMGVSAASGAAGVAVS